MQHSDLITAMILETGINPTLIYCQVTGKPIGQISDIAFDTMIQLIRPCSDDDCISELWTRTIASMRPSPAWNMIRGDSLSKMLDADPRGLLSYLMNRLYDPLDGVASRKMSMDTRLGYLANHIKVWNRIATLQIDREVMNQLLLVLLELDSKYGLRNHAHPAVTDSINLSLTQHSDQLALVRHLNAWLDSLNAKAEKAMRDQAASDRSYLAGNRTTRSAYVKQFTRVTPPSKTKAAATAKTAQADYLDSIMDSIWKDGPAPLGDAPYLATPSAAHNPAKWTPAALAKRRNALPAAPTLTTIPRRFGVKQGA